MKLLPDIGLLKRGPPVNWFGIIAGILMIVLPFMGAWWRVVAGVDAAEITLSPFDYGMSLGEQSFISPMFSIFLLAAKLGMIIAGTFMILGSLFPKRWFSPQLIKFGIMRPFWAVIIEPSRSRYLGSPRAARPVILPSCRFALNPQIAVMYA